MLHNERILDMSFPQEKPNTEAPEEFENVSLLLWQDLPLTTNPWEKNDAFQTGGIWKRWLCVLVWTEKILKTEVFENADYVISLQELSSVKHKCLWTVVEFSKVSLV